MANLSKDQAPRLDSVVVYSLFVGVAPIVCRGLVLDHCFVVSSSVLSNFAIISLRKRDLVAYLQQ